MEEEEREKCGIVTINRPIDRPRPPANPSATVFINNVSVIEVIVMIIER